MGALVWYWGKEGKACGKERFERGLKALEEADLNIKRSRLDPQYAVEKLVVELGLLTCAAKELCEAGFSSGRCFFVHDVAFGRFIEFFVDFFEQFFSISLFFSGSGQ